MPDRYQIPPASILLVDDDPGNLLALQTVLLDLRQTLVSASSGREALRCLLKQRFAVILLDVNLPDMDGFEIAQMLREREESKDVPIIFVTGAYKDIEHISHAYKLKAVDYLIKPFAPEILRTKVAVLVELHQNNLRLQEQAELLRQSELHLEKLVKERTEKLNQAIAELARSNAELEQFAYVASHDLQEPLRAISGYLQIIERRHKGKLDAETDRFITGAVEGAGRMKAMIDALLNYSRVGRRDVPFGLVECSSVLEQALQNLRVAVEESGATVTHDPLPPLMADNIQMVQLFQNLVGNAIKFHKPGKPPQIHISAKRLPSSALSPDSALPEGEELGVREDDGWLFAVSDNGIGIEPQYAGRIFQIFQRLHTRQEYPGTGIGLAVCRKIIEHHGGKIWVESEFGKGATFLFTIPEKGTATDGQSE